MTEATDTGAQLGAVMRETVCRQLAEQQLDLARTWWKAGAGSDTDRAFVFGVCTAAALARFQGPVTRGALGSSTQDVAMLARKFYREVTGLGGNDT